MGAHQWGRLDPAYGGRGPLTKEAAPWLAGRIDAMVSAPLNKEAMHEAGYSYEDRPRSLGELTHSKPAMVMVVDRMRLMLFTKPHGDATGVRLRAPGPGARASGARRRGVARHGYPAAEHRDRRPESHATRTVCSGREELDEIVPARGGRPGPRIDAHGPFPADTVFLKARDGAYDMTIALLPRPGAHGRQVGRFGRVVTLLIGLR